MERLIQKWSHDRILWLAVAIIGLGALAPLALLSLFNVKNLDLGLAVFAAFTIPSTVYGFWLFLRSGDRTRPWKSTLFDVIRVFLASVAITGVFIAIVLYLVR